jgi:hypothetical protein
MANFITGILGMAAVSFFMGIMVWWVPAPPLIIICLIVGALMAKDFVDSLKASNGAN